MKQFRETIWLFVATSTLKEFWDLIPEDATENPRNTAGAKPEGFERSI